MRKVRRCHQMAIESRRHPGEWWKQTSVVLVGINSRVQGQKPVLCCFDVLRYSNEAYGNGSWYLPAVLVTCRTIVSKTGFGVDMLTAVSKQQQRFLEDSRLQLQRATPPTSPL